MQDDSNIAPVINSESNSGVSAPVESNQAPVSSSSQPEVSQTEANASVATNASPTANEQAQQAKRLYEREEVNRIARHAAEEREARVRAEYERNRQYSTPQSFQPQQQQANQAQVPIEVTKQHIQQIAFEERMAMESDSLRSKIINAESKYSDYSAVTDVLTDIVNNHTAPIFNGLDNAADVIYELGKNPGKIPPQLFELARDPFNANNAIRARRALDTISNQLKANEAARKQPLPKEPLQHEKPTTAAMDSGKVTVADLRRMKKYQT